ncbi:hypothetical protein [Bernardetia sp.]|uniref:hypothetical protein n=1 Tax=Bernardetia sp. TaxID=1937974 RepID=UPI0025C19414|nr:hypothetical protein [Bernardetia sp.]
MASEFLEKMYKEFLEEFDNKTLSELIKDFNREVGNKGWAGIRGAYLMAMKDAFLKYEDLDSSSIIDKDKNGISLGRKIRLENNVLVTEGENFGGAAYSVE